MFITQWLCQVSRSKKFSIYNGQDVLIIPPLLVNNKFISDFEAKANFQNFFAPKYIPLNNSKIPEN